MRVGGLEAFGYDVEIPLKYGVDQCVADTLGPGGIFYAFRTIPVLLDIAADIRELAPGALFLNYSNPMAMKDVYKRQMPRSSASSRLWSWGAISPAPTIACRWTPSGRTCSTTAIACARRSRKRE